MEFKDLKSAWDTYSSQEVDKHHLGKESINELVRTRTKSLVERIDRNIRIGMFLLGVYVAYVLIDYLFLAEYFSKIIIGEVIEYPKWLEPLDVFLNTLIVTTYLFFVIRYLKIKRSFSVDLHLKDFLIRILDTLKTYRRMFYLVVIILMVSIMMSFFAGFYQGIKFNAGKMPGGIENISASKILLIIGVGLAFLIPMVAGTFFILRWGFNKLYGRYLVKLNETLQELDETGSEKNGD
jgi:hypothetical protein